MNELKSKKSSKRIEQHRSASSRNVAKLFSFCRLARSNLSVGAPCVAVSGRTSARLKHGIIDAEYHFDGVFSETSTQADVFEDVGIPVVKNLISGNNPCIIVLGGANSGKTFTVVGRPDNPGILPKLLDTLFNSIETNGATAAGSGRDTWEMISISKWEGRIPVREGTTSYSVAVSFAVVSDEDGTIVDLFSPEFKSVGLHSGDALQSKKVGSTKEAFSFLVEGEMAKKTRITAKAFATVFRVTLYQKCIESPLKEFQAVSECLVVECSMSALDTGTLLRGIRKGEAGVPHEKSSLESLLRVHLDHPNRGILHVMCCLNPHPRCYNENQEILDWSKKLQHRAGLWSIVDSVPSIEELDPLNCSWIEALRKDIQGSLISKQSLISKFVSKQNAFEHSLLREVSEYGALNKRKAELETEQLSLYDDERRLTGVNKQLERRLADLNKRVSKQEVEERNKERKEQQFRQQQKELEDRVRKTDRTLLQIMKLTGEKEQKFAK